MPVVAVGFAVAAIAVAVDVGTTLAIVAAVGATIAAVGAVTNNRTLMIAGGVIGAIGGIGALATSAGIIGADAFSFGSNAASGLASDSAIAGGITSDAGFAGAVGADVVPGGAAAVGDASVSAAGGTSDIIDQIAGTVQPVEGSTSPVIASADAPNVAPTAAVDNSTIPQGVENEQQASSLGLPTGQGDSPPPVGQAPTAPTAPSDPTVAGSTPGTANPMDAGIPGSYQAAQNAVGKVGAVTMPATDGSGIWGTIKDLLGSNGGGRLLSGVVQAGSSFISGATNGLTPAQIAALNAQAQANQAAANLSNRQQANMAEPLPVASRAPPITGAPAGLINTPPPRIPVTGAA